MKTLSFEELKTVAPTLNVNFPSDVTFPMWSVDIVRNGKVSFVMIEKNGRVWTATVPAKDYEMQCHGDLIL